MLGWIIIFCLFTILSAAGFGWSRGAEYSLARAACGVFSGLLIVSIASVVVGRLFRNSLR